MGDFLLFGRVRCPMTRIRRGNGVAQPVLRAVYHPLSISLSVCCLGRRYGRQVHVHRGFSALLDHMNGIGGYQVRSSAGLPSIHRYCALLAGRQWVVHVSSYDEPG